MRRAHASIWMAGLLGLGVGLAGSVPGQAQGGTGQIDLYVGGAAGAEGIKLGGWGSGMATADATYKTIGEASIKVETNGYYAGGRIEFEEPKDISAVKNDPFGFLEFVVKFQPGKKKERQQENNNPEMGYPGSGGAPASPGSGGAFAEGGAPGEIGGFPGAFPGGGFPGAPGAAPAEEQLRPDTDFVKVQIKCEEGTFTATDFPNLMLPSAQDGWYSVAIPFVKFNGLDKVDTAKIQEIRVFGNYKDTFWIGEIRTTVDDEPINADPVDDEERSVGELIEFRAQATGGLSPLQYVWDFDKSDGLQEDAIGQVVHKAFFKPSPDAPGRPGEPQPYLVTLTVRDLSGAKRSVRKECNVIVNR